MITSVATETKTIRVLYGQEQTYSIVKDNTIDLYLKIPVLGQQNIEDLISQSGKIYQDSDFYLFETEDKLVGTLIKDISFPLEKDAYEIYHNLLRLTKDWNFFRICNYVPYIIGETSGLENYQSYCKGRSLAFEEFYGSDLDNKLPSATAVGINDNKLCIYFVAGKQKAVHVENPEQVSASSYPKEYGPKAPSFARGTLTFQGGKRIGYLSGTASVKGHESVGINDITKQIYTTVDNMGLVFEVLGFGRGIPDPSKYNRTFKVYIKNEVDTTIVQELTQKLFNAEEKDIVYLHSDICRSELLIEIEGLIEEK
ncbi:3-hydroxybenzoate synthase [Scytonema sp. HK-05]|uniref:chorismate transformation enzyme, FkbO/Hyg5 family n=1 Tax=Scytonema sp. HK-05 TaxID=1137095 RepID=UPI000AD84D04|nr:hypothetical protein [Scytonema sp. HK-05]BAY43377.1 3-hydroxybenzoate synthase [Scytonema sp. HK-05]